MTAYGYDEDGEREHDCCDRCGRGSCPGSGSGGEDACTAHLPRRAAHLTPDQHATAQAFEDAPCAFRGDLTLPAGLGTGCTASVVMHRDVVFEGYDDDGRDRRETTHTHDAQVFTSRVPGLDGVFDGDDTDPDHPFGKRPDGGWHYPVVDLDVPCELVRSSSSDQHGGGHLVVRSAVPWPKYVRLLEALADCGLVEPGYVKASVARGHTAARVPWQVKGANDLPTTWAQLQPGHVDPGDPFGGLLAPEHGQDRHGYPLGQKPQDGEPGA